MRDKLPEYIDPVVFAERRTEIKGKIKLSVMQRLAEGLLDSAGEVEINLFFHKQGRFPVIEGDAKVNLLMQCQNCLEAVSVPLNASIKLALVSKLEQADELQDGFEPILAEGEKISLSEMVEDELILAVPVFPKHSELCTISEAKVRLSESRIEASNVKKIDNPFAVLAKLKKTGDM